MYIRIKEGSAVVDPQGMALPNIKKLYKLDKTRGKKSFEAWMRFVYYCYDKESIYRNYLPEEREKNVVDAMFSDKGLKYFKNQAGLKAVIEEYQALSYSFKERLYRRLLNDIEDMLDRISKVEMTKTARVTGKRRVRFKSQITGEMVDEEVPLDVRVSIDNSEEKVKLMDLEDKLLKRELVYKKLLKEEQVEAELKKASERRMFDR